MSTIHRRRLTKSGKVVSRAMGIEPGRLWIVLVACLRPDPLSSSELLRRRVQPALRSFETASPATTATRHDRVPNRGYRQCSPRESNPAPHHARERARESREGLARVATLALYTAREIRKARETTNFSARKSADFSWSPCYHHATTGVLFLPSSPAISDASEGRFPASVLTPQRLRT